MYNKIKTNFSHCTYKVGSPDGLCWTMEISPITNPRRKLILDVKGHFEWQCVTLMVGAKFFGMSEKS